MLTEEQFKAAEANGVSRKTAEKRYYAYWSIEDIINTKKGKRRKKHRDPHILAAEEKGICYSTYKNRLRTQGMTPEEAAVAPLAKGNPNGRPGYENVELQRVRSAGLSASTYYRKRKTMTVKEIIAEGRKKAGRPRKEGGK